LKVNISQDVEWADTRQKRWEDIWENGLRVIGISKSEKKAEDELVLAQKEWYLEGDLSALINTSEKHRDQEPLDLKNVLMLCPIVDLGEYLRFIQKYCELLSKKELCFWMPSVVDRNVQFFESLFSFYSHENSDSTEEIFSHMLELMIPNDDGYVEFPYELGIDLWRPKQEVSQSTVAFDVLKSLGSYLFSSEDESKRYKHLPTTLRSIKWIKDLNPGYYDTVLIDGKPKRPAPPPAARRVSASGQKLIRAVIGNLLGYKSYYDEYRGPLRHNDPDVEKQLIDLISSLDMPEKYHRLVEFIRAHPDDFVKRSE